MAKAKRFQNSRGQYRVRLTLSPKEAAAVKIAVSAVTGNRTTWFKQADDVWQALDEVLTCIPFGVFPATEGFVKALKPIGEVVWQ